MKYKFNKILILLITLSILFPIINISIIDSSLMATETIHLPDIQLGEKNKRFTCTGLAYDNKDDVFYVGNIGKSLPENIGFKSTIVKLSSDFKKIWGNKSI